MTAASGTCAHRPSLTGAIWVCLAPGGTGRHGGPLSTSCFLPPLPVSPSACPLALMSPKWCPRPLLFWSCVLSRAFSPLTGLHSEYFKACGPHSLSRHHSVLPGVAEAAKGSVEANGCGCVQAKLYLPTLTCESHIIFMCHKLSFF